LRESKVTVAVVVAVVLLLCAYVFVFQVRVNEVAVHYRPPGNVHRVINRGSGMGEQEGGPGLYFRLPYPIDNVKTYDKRIRVLDGPLAQTQLKDDHQIIISMYCAWHISDPVKFQETLEGSVEKARQRLRELIYNETSKAVSSLTFNDLVSTDEAQVNQNFDALEKEILSALGVPVRDNGYGLRVNEFGIRRIAIPEETTREVFERMRAEREKVAAAYKQEGERRKKTIIAEARKEADQILADADSKAKGIRSEGEAEEAKYYDLFAEEPELAIFLRRLEALRTIARKARDADQPITFVLDPQTEPLSVLSRGPQEREELGETAPPPSEEGQKPQMPQNPREEEAATEKAGESAKSGE
jgi:membrane protease subunit HflC